MRTTQSFRSRTLILTRNTGFFLTILLLAYFASPRCLSAQDRFLRGDADSDGQISITDVIVILGFGFLGGPPPPCLDAADFDDDGVIIPMLDGITYFLFLFGPGPPPPPPGFVCGLDPTADALDCAMGSNSCP